MLTRLRVSGFKNLVDVDVRFGPFTCIAGTNGVGKSNLFDAIRFLGALADRSFVDAAGLVRESSGGAADVRELFHRIGDSHDREMRFEVTMIVPAGGYDELGTGTSTDNTLLRYAVALRYRGEETDNPGLGFLELLSEDLQALSLQDTSQPVLFDCSKSWLGSVVPDARRARIISTDKAGTVRFRLGGQANKARRYSASALPRALLSTALTDEHPSAVLARLELQSWQVLHLEPSALRRPDDLGASPRLGFDGSHLPATLYRLVRLSERGLGRGGEVPDVGGYLAARLSELIGGVRGVRIDRDDKRSLLSLELIDRDGTVYPARSLSDGSLRFLALAVLELDPNGPGLVGVEEPENGLHPGRIPAMLRLLRDLATDTHLPVGPDNPLRQVIVNTHSPAVVQQVPEDSLLVADLETRTLAGRRFQGVRFRCLADTWRASAPEHTRTVAPGQLLSYLNPGVGESSSDEGNGAPTVRAVRQRPDLQPYLFPQADNGK